MIYEFALEPKVVANWAIARAGRYISQFGLDSRRIVSDFPVNWKGAVYGDFLARYGYDYGHPDVANTAPILDSYLQLLTDCMVHRPIELVADADWVDEAIREHASRPFHAILAAERRENPPAGLITESNTDDLRDPYWPLPTIATTRKTAIELGAALRPILQASSDIHIIDPYFDPQARRFQESFAEIARQAAKAPRAVAQTPGITLVTGIERLFKDSERAVDETGRRKRFEQERKAAAAILQLARQHLPRLIPGSMAARLIVLRNAPGGDPLHNRFVLTNVGGVVLPYGVDIYDRDADHAAVDDLLPMPKGVYQERWAQYVRIGAAAIVLGPEDISDPR